MNETKTLPLPFMADRQAALSNAFTALKLVERILRSGCYATETTVDALVVLEQAADLTFAAIKYDFVEESRSSTTLHPAHSPKV